jgi:hypothetical protein
MELALYDSQLNPKGSIEAIVGNGGSVGERGSHSDGNASNVDRWFLVRHPTLGGSLPRVYSFVEVFGRDYAFRIVALWRPPLVEGFS